jgi:[acyl-carrier-protein] S-malonyltransferase
MISDSNRNSITAAVFPGVGVELCGAEVGFFQQYRSLFISFFDEASNHAGVDLTTCFVQNDLSSLTGMQVQFLTYAFSAGMWQVISEKKITVTHIAGNSFGLYCALYAAGVLTFKNGLTVIKNAYEAMERACAGLAFRTTAIVGLSLHDFESICSKNDKASVRRVNTNNNTCHIMCGTQEDMDEFEQRALAQGALSIVPVHVPHPYHHASLCKIATDDFLRMLKKIEWHPAAIPIVSTIDSHFISQPDDIQSFTAQHLGSAINWHAAVQRLYDSGCTRIIECGLGISLTQNARFMDGHATWVNTKNCLGRLGI